MDDYIVQIDSQLVRHGLAHFHAEAVEDAPDWPGWVVLTTGAFEGTDHFEEYVMNGVLLKYPHEVAHILTDLPLVQEHLLWYCLEARIIESDRRLRWQRGQGYFCLEPHPDEGDATRPDAQIPALPPRELAVWHMRRAADLLEQAAQDDAPVDEDAEAPARAYRHVCRQCGVPVEAEGLCWHCEEGA